MMLKNFMARVRQISNKGIFKMRQGKMLFSRFGPMSGQVQEKRERRATPTRKGIWVFPYPLFDMFFAHHQINRFLPKNARNESAASILDLPTDIKDFSNMDDDGNPIKILTPEEDAALEKEAEAYWEEKEKIQKEYWDKFMKVRKIWWGGEVYSRLQPDKLATPVNDWYWYKKPIDFLKVAKKNLKSGEAKVMANQGVGKENLFHLSVDHFECFLPTT
jgi:hypothetical protein